MTASQSVVFDGRGRTVNYLRLSVTDRCNLSCLYCRPGSQIPFIPHADILRYEEMLDLVALAREMGITKVRLTGGEPFARKSLLVLVEAIRRRFPDTDLRLTTNGTMLAGYVEPLAACGVSAVNISLDSLDRATYARITGSDRFDVVRQAIDACLRASLRVKLNVVALRGINDAEIPAFVRLAEKLPLDVRVIEFMPIGSARSWRPELFVSAHDALLLASRQVELIPEAQRHDTAGPARMYRIAGGQGRFGVISPLTDHFCKSCNRIRITADGKLRTCLFAGREYRLRPLLRNPRLGLPTVRRVIAMALRHKPLGFEVLAAKGDRGDRGMSAIGG